MSHHRTAVAGRQAAAAGSPGVLARQETAAEPFRLDAFMDLNLTLERSRCIGL